MSIIANETTSSNKLQTIDFHGQPLITIEQDGVHYTAVKPICENIGLVWNGQFERIKRDDVLSSTIRVIRIVAEDGKNRDMVCLPIEFLNGWLFGVDSKRVKSENKAPLILYKMECYKVLNDYWHKGEATNPRAVDDSNRQSTVGDRNGLVKADNMAMKRLDLDYSEAFNLVRHRFNVAHIGDLSVAQVGEATEYIQRMMFSTPNQQQVDNIAPPLRPYEYANNERLVSQADSEGHLWTRPLADHEYVLSSLSLPKFIANHDDFTFNELVALNMAVSKRLFHVTPADALEAVAVPYEQQV